MKFTCLIENFKKGVSVSEKITSLNLSLPILNNILLTTTSNNKLQISATDLEIGLNFLVSGKVEEKGSILIPSRLLANLLNNLKDEKITLETKDNTLKIQTKNSEFTIQGANQEEYPIIPQIDSLQYFEINSKLLESSLIKLVKSAGAGLSRPELNSVYLYQKNNDFFQSIDLQLDISKDIINILLATRCLFSGWLK